MITKKDILKMVHHVVKRSRGIPDKRLTHPVREWLIGLTLATLVFVGGALYASKLFTTIDTISNNNNVAEDIPVRYNGDAVLEALELFEDRVNSFEKLRADKRFLPPPIAEDVVDENADESRDVGTLDVQ